jgi:hypothetical protein
MRNGTSVYITTAGLSYDALPEEMVVYDPDVKVLVNRMTMGRYDNLAYDSTTRILRDRESGMQLPLSGLYSLELFNTFKATEVFTMENEDWHHKDLELGKYTATLYQLEERT